MVGSSGGMILGFVGILLRAHVLLGIGFAIAGLALIFFAREFAKELVRANSAMPCL